MQEMIIHVSIYVYYIMYIYIDIYNMFVYVEWNCIKIKINQFPHIKISLYILLSSLNFKFLAIIYYIFFKITLFP